MDGKVSLGIMGPVTTGCECRGSSETQGVVSVK